MNYWFLFTIVTGAIYGTPYLGNATEWTNIPAGCAVLGPFNASMASATVQDAYAHPNYYTVQNGDFTAVSNISTLQLADAQQAKTAQIQQAYQAEINSTVTSSATGTALVYSYSPESQQLWSDLFKAIDKNLLPSTAFPMDITLANGTVVSHTQAQLVQIEADIAAWKFPLYQKYQKLVTSTIPSATTIDQVNTITW